MSRIPTRRDFGLDARGRAARARRVTAAIYRAWREEAEGVLPRDVFLLGYKQALHPMRATQQRARVVMPGSQIPPQVRLLARTAEFGAGPAGLGSFGPFNLRRFLQRRKTGVSAAVVRALIGSGLVDRDTGGRLPAGHMPTRRTAPRSIPVTDTAGTLEALAGRGPPWYHPGVRPVGVADRVRMRLSGIVAGALL